MSKISEIAHLPRRDYKTSLFDQPISEARVREIVCEELEAMRDRQLIPGRAMAPSCALCIKLASEMFGVSEEDILSPSREHKFLEARFAALWLAYKVTGQSYPRIGQRFKRDHSTVIYGVRKADELRATDGDYREQTNRLLAYFFPER